MYKGILCIYSGIYIYIRIIIIIIIQYQVDLFLPIAELLEVTTYSTWIRSPLA